MTIDKSIEILNNYDAVYLPRTMFNGIVKALYQAVELSTGDDDDINVFEIARHSADEYTLSVTYCCVPTVQVAADFKILKDE